MTSFQKIAKINLTICSVILLASGCERGVAPSESRSAPPNESNSDGIISGDKSLEAQAPEAAASQISEALEVTQGWLRATGGSVTAGYLVLSNNSPSDDRLIAVRSALSDQVEIHDTLEEDGVRRMRRRASFDIPAGETRALAPGGAHLMMFGLEAPLEAGGAHEIVLTFEQAGDIPIMLEVRNPASASTEKPHAH